MRVSRVSHLRVAEFHALPLRVLRHSDGLKAAARCTPPLGAAVGSAGFGTPSNAGARVRHQEALAHQGVVRAVGRCAFLLAQREQEDRLQHWAHPGRSIAARAASRGGQEKDAAAAGWLEWRGVFPVGQAPRVAAMARRHRQGPRWEDLSLRSVPSPHSFDQPRRYWI